jgi:catechol 2,3-dioxygenase-like lactoylglutathione lyase family enzyme
MVAKGTLRHLSLEVGDVVRSRAFYDRFLPRVGFRRFVAEAEYLGYTDGAMTLWLVRNPTPRIHRHPPTGEEEIIAEHIAFHMPSAAAVRAAEAELTAGELYPFFRGEEHPEFRPGYFSATWLDPDGVAIELYAIGAAPARRRRPSARRSARHTARRVRSGRRRRAAA